MHTVLPQTLLDRLLLHHQVGASATPDLDGQSEIGPDQMQSLDHMFYTSAVIAVYQLMLVRIPRVSTRTVVLIVWMCSAWTNFKPLRVDFAGKYLCAASRGGGFSTSRGGEPIRTPSHERIPLMSENPLSRMERAVGKEFEGLSLWSHLLQSPFI